MVGLFWSGYLAILVGFGSLKGMSPPAWRDLSWGAVCAIALVVLTGWFVRRDRGRLQSVGAALKRGSGLRLLLGVAFGLALYALIFGAVSLTAGPLRLVPAVGGASIGATALVVVGFLALGAMEELGFRGYPLRTLARTLGEEPAQVLVAVAFGGSHLLYGWTWQAVVLGVIPSGLLFGAAASTSRGLAFPIGLHAALNLAAWSLGMKESPGLWTVTQPEGMAERIAGVATWVGLGVTLGATLALHLAKGRGVTKILASASPAP